MFVKWIDLDVFNIFYLKLIDDRENCEMIGVWIFNYLIMDINYLIMDM